jgi:very-short-patch-repair endonuclease
MGSLLIPLVLILVVIAIVAVIAAQKGRLPSSAPEEPAFDACKELFTPAERSFYGVLEQALAGEFKVFGKVRLGDLVQPARGLSQSVRTRSRNRIQQKHVDFVLCRPDNLEVAGVVELDDASHGRKDRADRDDFVDQALASAGVPVLHVPARKAYAVAEVRAKLAESFALKPAAAEAAKAPEALAVAAEPEKPSVQVPVAQPQVTAEVAQPAAGPPVAASPAAPVCPACSSEMVKRQARKGQYAGKWFWACSGYPGCRKIVAVG